MRTMKIMALSLVLTGSLAGEVWAQELSGSKSTAQTTPPPLSTAPSTGAATLSPEVMQQIAIYNSALRDSEMRANAALLNPFLQTTEGAGKKEEEKPKTRYRHVYQGDDRIYGTMPMPQRVFNNIR